MSPAPLPGSVADRTATPTARALRRDAAENRQRLLDAAGVVFAEHGLDGSVEEVARVAGVGMGTLYRRFPTKDALIAELVRELLAYVLTLAHEARTVAHGQGLEQFLFATGEAEASQRGCLARLWNDPETVVLKEECRAAIGELLADAQAHGQVRDDAEASDLDVLFWSLRGVIEASQRVTTAAWQRHIAIMIAGLRPSAEPLLRPALTEDQRREIRRAG